MHYIYKNSLPVKVQRSLCNYATSVYVRVFTSYRDTLSNGSKGVKATFTALHHSVKTALA